MGLDSGMGLFFSLASSRDFFFFPLRCLGWGVNIYILLGIPCIGWGGIEEYRNNAFTEI